MDSKEGQGIAARLTREGERQGGHDEPIKDGHGIYHHYYGPVNMNHIGMANNPNFGAIYGHLDQSMYSTSPPAPGYAFTAGGHAQPMVGADIFSRLDAILDASHTRNMKHSPPNSQCLPGTRSKVIGDIQAWADSHDLGTKPHILWLYGYAGCGKSAIAHEIAKIYDDRGRLAACFVFFRGSGDRSTSVKFATTVASQVAAAFPATTPLIDSALKRNPGLLSTTTASLSHQFEKLVYLPIHAIASQIPAAVIVVLDGVDECQDRDDISSLIEDMVRYFELCPQTPLRFLIASRVEDHLHKVLHSSNQVYLLNLVERTSDADIAAALDVAIANAKRGRLLACDENWPDEWDRRSLVKHIGGSFLFMDLILKKLFNQDPKDRLTPMERLPRILMMQNNFDDMYTEILAPWQDLPHFDAVLGTIAIAFEPLSIVQLAGILSIKTVNVVNVLINLQSILQLPGDDRSPITLWHTSLRDFLCTNYRSGALCTHPNHHQRLAYCDIYSPTSLQDEATPYGKRFALLHLERFCSMTVGQVQDDVKQQLNGPIYRTGQTALEVASHDKNWAVVRCLAIAGVDLDTKFQNSHKGGMYALHAACNEKQWDVIYLLLDKGANPNIVGPKPDYGGFPYGTPLAFAAYWGNVRLATRLLE